MLQAIEISHSHHQREMISFEKLLFIIVRNIVAPGHLGIDCASKSSTGRRAIG